MMEWGNDARYKKVKPKNIGTYIVLFTLIIIDMCSLTNINYKKILFSYSLNNNNPSKCINCAC